MVQVDMIVVEDIEAIDQQLADLLEQVEDIVAIDQQQVDSLEFVEVG